MCSLQIDTLLNISTHHAMPQMTLPVLPDAMNDIWADRMVNTFSLMCSSMLKELQMLNDHINLCIMRTKQI